MHDDRGGRRLAGSEVGFVEDCGCGFVHLGLGPVTIRLSSEAFDAAVEMLIEARVRRDVSRMIGNRDENTH